MSAGSSSGTAWAGGDGRGEPAPPGYDSFPRDLTAEGLPAAVGRSPGLCQESSGDLLPRAQACLKGGSP